MSSLWNLICLLPYVPFNYLYKSFYLFTQHHPEYERIISSPGEKPDSLTLQVTNESLDVPFGSPTEESQSDLFQFMRTQSATIPRSPSIRRRDAKSYRRSLSADKTRGVIQLEGADASPVERRFEVSSPVRRRRPLTLHIPDQGTPESHFAKGKRIKRAQSERRVVTRQVVDEHGRKRTKEIVEPTSPRTKDAGTVIIHSPNQFGSTSSEEVKRSYFL